MRTAIARRTAPLVLGLMLALAPAAGGAASGDLSGVVNVNTATLAELVELPGIGDAKAAALLALREERGRFRSLEELLDVKGIGPTALERMRPYVALSGQTTIARE